MKPFTQYSDEYIKGKAAKVIPGRYHLLIHPHTVYVLKLHRVESHGKYSSSVMGTWKDTSEKGWETKVHDYGQYFWFKQPSYNCTANVVDVFPLYAEDQLSANEEAKWLLKVYFSHRGALDDKRLLRFLERH